MYKLPVENQSLEMVESILKALMAKSEVEFTWYDLKKHKNSFVTKNAHMLGEKVLDIINIQNDKNETVKNIFELPVDDCDEEPTPSSWDNFVPN